ncbi:hypothetical protein KIL84_018424 [Mauremys mutica]|uniref:Uncharacterized protein n=1 Tax=Mauremys mutica TaxID=74926 RepID=A0A9D3XUS0_9SAUR|nr:hypothetical protein KIL84_018424 [Mauremys mutica]
MAAWHCLELAGGSPTRGRALLWWLQLLTSQSPVRWLQSIWVSLSPRPSPDLSGLGCQSGTLPLAWLRAELGPDRADLKAAWESQAPLPILPSGRPAPATPGNSFTSSCCSSTSLPHASPCPSTGKAQGVSSAERVSAPAQLSTAPPGLA